MNRNPVFDEVKGLAIWLVVLGHLVSQVGNKTVICISFFHMPVMIFISGYFFYYSMNKYRKGELILNKFKGLMIPYISWSTIALLFNVVIFYCSRKFSIKTFIHEVVDIFFYARSVWYLLILFLSFIIFMMCKKFSEIIHISYFLILLIIWISLCFLGPNELFAFYKFKWLFLFMIAGYECAKYNIIDRIKCHKKSTCICGLIIFGGLVWCLYKKEYFGQYITGNYISLKSTLFGGLYYAISFYSIIIAFLLFKNNIGIKIKKYFRDVGKLSLDIYVIHMFPLKLVQIIFPTNLFSNLQVYESTIIIYGIMCILTFAIVGLIKWLYYTILEKLKVYKLIMGKF